MVCDRKSEVHVPRRARAVACALLAAAALASAEGCEKQALQTAPAPAARKPAPAARKPGAGAPEKPATAPAAPGEDRALRVRLLVTGETHGYLTPCGCTDGMLGGLARRRTLIDREREGGRPVVAVDLGGLVKDNGRLSEIKIDTILASYEVLGYAAVVPGAPELSLGEAFAASLRGHPGFPLVAANLRAPPLDAVLEPYRIVRLEAPEGAEVRVGITGVLDPDLAGEYGLESRFRIEDPVAALEAVAPALRKGADVSVLLAHAPEDRARAWARAVPGFHVVAAGLGQEYPQERVAPAHGRLLFHPGTWGKYLVRVDLDLGPAGPRWSYARVAVEESVPSDPEINALILAYQRIIQQLGERGEFLKEKRDHPRDRFVGSPACKDCHEPSWEIFGRSKHARGMATLKELGVDKDPECIPCHAVGWAYTSGFRSLRETPGLAGIGCEACHGPGRRHVDTGGDTKLEPAGEARCRACHTEIRSPEFDFERYWGPIGHEE